MDFLKFPLSLGAMLIGGIASADEEKKMKKQVEGLQSISRAQYLRRRHEDAVRRSDAQQLLRRTEDTLMRSLREARGVAAVHGLSPAAEATRKNVAADAMAKTAAAIDANAAAGKSDLDRDHMQQEERYAQMLNTLRQSRRQQIAGALSQF